MNAATSSSTGPAQAGQSMRAIFASQRWIDSMLEFEAALAGAQARHGVLDSASAQAIAACCHSGTIDAGALGQHAVASGALADAVIERLGELVAKHNTQAAHLVYFGVARQDLRDTAMMLRARDGL
ncbi:MAG: 3-carboxy-cis,cis-muconate cycloisomerase, partial [Pseudomonadota bacterium]|nr:3-carboxy-cis,cis-muconate cycloisomerase [Pseudomonadota bacterium]